MSQTVYRKIHSLFSTKVIKMLAPEYFQEVLASELILIKDMGKLWLDVNRVQN